jgi:ABC-type glutathione transport system ATPase component
MMMTKSSILSARAIHAGYPGVPVLSGVDIEIRSGQPPVGLVGASGAGKSTLIDVLRGVMRTSHGDAKFNGRVVSHMRGSAKKDFKASVRFVSQDALTITDPRDTPKLRLDTASKTARKAGRTHAVSPEQMLETVGLPGGLLKRSMNTLSGGEKQRVALATALATRPEMLLLDEPLTAVDPATRGEIAADLRQMAEKLGVGLLIASHDLELVDRMCPEVNFLADGEIVARGNLDEMLTHPTHPAIRDLGQAAPFAVQRFR